LKIDPCSEADLESHNADRRQICEDLAGSIRIRYFTALDDDTVKQFSVLDPRRWPKKDADALLSHGNVQISQLIHTYRAFFQNPNGTSVPGELVLTQWKQMKNLIVSDASLSRMKFNELWPMMLDGYAQQFHPACDWHRSHILSRHEWLRTLDFPHERPQDEVPGENGTRDPARFGLVVQVATSAQAL
jgi:hypothetical protein